MAEIIEMPKLSDTMSVGTVVNWLKKEGDPVKSGDMLCEVETDKATMEVESFIDGVLLKIYVQEGSEVPIGDPMCAVGEKGEAAPEIKKPAAEVPEDKAAKESTESGKKSGGEAEPEGRKQEYIPEEDTEEDSTKAEERGQTKRVKASPLARKLAAEKGLPLESIRGSGPAGRIVKKDVIAAAEKGIGAMPAAHAEKATKQDTDLKLSNMRKTIAARLVESKTTIPHFYLEIEADAKALIDTRAAINNQFSDLKPEQGGMKLTVNDCILKAAAEALLRVPAVNASWKEDRIRRHGGVHLAFGVAVDDGLVTPVIRDAQAKTLREISAEAKSLIAKARDKKLTPNEMSGSTFTVTNLGMFGVSGFFGIINPPNAAILSVGATVRKPVVDEHGQLTVGHRMVLGLSCDHRVVDGATGAQYLQALKSIIEAPALMLV